jgi:hypothetical protein
VKHRLSGASCVEYWDLSNDTANTAVIILKGEYVLVDHLGRLGH